MSRFADREEIRQAYWALTRRLRQQRRDAAHDARLAEIQRAFDVLSDAARRVGYDRRRLVEGSRSAACEPEARRPAMREVRGADGKRDAEAGLAAREVEVGFPSMRRVVPRVLADFLGDDSAQGALTHRTEVAVTPRQAREGTHVPIALPLRPTCPMCGGRGEIWPVSCRVCEGTGSGLLPHRVTLPIPPGVRNGARLSFSVTAPFSGEARVELRVAIQQ